jgi:parvulin-like peptidyl-prolyl isomerase
MIFLILLNGCSGDRSGFFGKMDDNVVVLVNGLPVTIQEVEERLRYIDQEREISPVKREKQSMVLKKAIVEELVNRKLLLAEALERGIEVQAEEVADERDRLFGRLTADELQEALENAQVTADRWEKIHAEEMMVRKLMDEITLGLSVSDGDVENYYKLNKAQFFQPESVRARQIVVTSEEEAQEIRVSISRGDDFAETARKVSFSPEAKDGGDLGFFERGQMPRELEYVAFSLKVGQLSQVVETPYGYHLILVEEKRPARQLDLEEVKGRVRETLMVREREKKFQELLVNLRSKADITFNRKHEKLLPDQKV